MEFTEPGRASQPDAAAPSDEQAAAAPALPSSPPESTSAAEATDTEVGGFGDDLAAMLSESAPVPSDEPTDVTPVSDAESQSAAVVGDRYAVREPVESASTDATPIATAPVDEPLLDTAPSDTSIFDDLPTDSASELAADVSPDAGTSAAEVAETLLDEPVDPNTPPGSPVNDAMLPEQREAIVESTDAFIPNLNDDEIPTSPTVAAWNTRRAAWLLGSKLSLAALANDYGGSAEKVQALFTQSRDLATMLEVQLADLPARPAASGPPAADAALNYLFAQGQLIGRELARRQGSDHAALFEVAVKSNILLVLYQPGAPTAQAIAKSIEQAGGRARLPATLWRPLVTSLDAKAALADVRAAVYRLHADTDKFLDQPPPSR